MDYVVNLVRIKCRFVSKSMSKSRFEKNPKSLLDLAESDDEWDTEIEKSFIKSKPSRMRAEGRDEKARKIRRVAPTYED